MLFFFFFFFHFFPPFARNEKRRTCLILQTALGYVLFSRKSVTWMVRETLINVGQHLRKESGFSRGEDVSMFLRTMTIYCVFEKRDAIQKYLGIK